MNLLPVIRSEKGQINAARREIGTQAHLDPRRHTSGKAIRISLALFLLRVVACRDPQPLVTFRNNLQPGSKWSQPLPAYQTPSPGELIPDSTKRS